MKAGRELDVLIAEKVMGLSLYGPIGEPGTLHGTASTPKYSTDIAAAWEVVEKMDHTHEISIDRYKRYDIVFGKMIENWQVRMESLFSPRPGGYGIAKTAPHAICLAALKVVGG